MMILIGGAGCEIVDSDGVEVVAFARMSAQDAADGPVVVGRKSISEVVGRGQRASHGESLVADKHTVAKRLSGEDFRGGVMTWSDHFAVSIYDDGVAIDDIILIGKGCFGVLGECMVGVKSIAGIEEDHELTLGHFKALIHSIIDTTVGFGEES